MNGLETVDKKTLWVDQEVAGSMWRFYYKQKHGQWVKDTKVKLLNGGISLLH